MLMHYYAVMKPVVGSQARFVFAGQLANAHDNCAPGLAWIQKNYGDVNKYIYGIAMAPYVYPSASVPYTDLPSLFTSMNTYITATIVPQLEQWSALAKQYDVKLLCYEAGQSLVAPDPSATFNFFLSAQLDPGMAAIHTALGKALAAAGVTLCNINDACDGWGGSGFWGLVTNVVETEPGATIAPPPKYAACVALAKNGTQNPARIPSSSTGGHHHHAPPPPHHHHAPPPPHHH